MDFWFGCFLILAGVYLVAVVVRGIAQFAFWLIENVLPASATGGPERRGDDQGGYARWILVSAARFALLHWLVALAEFVRMLVLRGRYDYWVGSALAAEDARKQVKYLTRALAINPGYLPAWGLKANALLALERYEEAMECFEKVLEIDPNSLVWYEKGLCCYHLGRFQEAVQCFDKALADGSDKNGKLRDDVLRHRKLAEAQMDRQEIA